MRLGIKLGRMYLCWYICPSYFVKIDGERRAGACSRREISKIWLKPNDYAKTVGDGGTAYAQTLLSLCDISPMRGIPSTTRADQRIDNSRMVLFEFAISMIESPHQWSENVSFAAQVATSFMRSITSFAVRQHRFPNANENDVCAYGTKRCSSLRSEIRPKGSAPALRSPSIFTKNKDDMY